LELSGNRHRPGTAIDLIRASFWITSFGPLIAGLLAAALNGAFNEAAAVMTCFAGLGIVAALLGRENER
jgi:1,4-dihydroxy-2-naphthoate octaprenyltransferase